MTDHTVRGITGTIPELMVAFGVRVSASTVYMRHCAKGWDWERCLLHPGRKPPTRPDNPAPIPPREEIITPWERAVELARIKYDLSLSDLLLEMVSAGFSRDLIAERLGLRITPQHFRGLQMRAKENDNP